MNPSTYTRELAAAAASRISQDAELLRAYVAPQTVPFPLGLSTKDIARYSVSKAIFGARRDGDKQSISFEWECSAELEKRLNRNCHPGAFLVPHEVVTRDLSAAVAPGGGYLVETDVPPRSFIGVLRSRAHVIRLGATVLPGLHGNLGIPKQTAGASPSWLNNESAQYPEGNSTFSQVAMTPKHVGSYQEVSRQLMQQAPIYCDDLLLRDMAASLAVEVDRAAIVGTGAAGQPLGILNTSGIGSVPGAAFAWDDALEMASVVETANALFNAGTSAYLTTPAVAKLLQQREKAAGSGFIMKEGASPGEGRIGLFQAASTTSVPAATMLFGDFSQLLIGEWGVLELQVNPYADFPRGITGVRAVWSVDVAPRHPGAFVASSSIS